MNGTNRARHRAVSAVMGLVALAAAGHAARPERVAASSTTGPAYALTVWSAETGASPGDVFAITQDLDGYLWLGTPRGLVRFDGFRFVPWADAGGTPVPGPVLALAGARDGGVWVGAASGVLRVSGTTVRRYTAADGFEGGVTALIEDRQGTIWVGNRRGLFRFTAGRWSSVGQADGYSGTEVFSLHEDQSGRLWIGSSSGVYSRGKDGFELLDAVSTNVQGFVEDDAGDIWVTDTSAAVRRLDSHVRATYAAGVRLPASGWRLLHDRRGRIWVAAQGGGLLHLDRAADDAVVRRFDYEHRMTGSTRSLYEDREGNIWVGLRGGLLRLSETVFRSDQTLEGLTQDGVRSVAVSGDGSVWIATGHSVNRFTSTGQAAYPLPQTLALHADRRGRMWASTANGLWRFDKERFNRVDVPGTLNWGRVMALTTDANDALWLCSSLKGVMTWDGHVLSSVEGQEETASRSCSSVYRDRRGRIWVGFSGGGAAVYERGVFQPIGEREGLTRGTVVTIAEDRAGSVWLATSSGLNRYRNGRITAVTPLNAPLSDVVPTLVEDDEGFLWVGIQAGAAILRIHQRELDKLTTNPTASLDYATFDSSDGLPQGSLSWQNGVTGVRGGDGRMWFAAGLGVTALDFTTPLRARRAQPPRIEAVVADGRRVAPDRGLSLPFGTSTLRVEFGAISLSAASKLRFRYMLEGLHDDWVPAGSTREAVFSDLPSGNYRFRLGSTYEGQWVESPTWDFAVAPPFYLTRWF
ncbi:MAG TPA: two-component regulator propeller domain-containing protein, partial [Vicinamibacterales bacterium]